MFLEILVTFMAVAFLLFALFLIPTLLQIRRTAEAIAVTLQALNENLPGILKNLERITANINQATFTVNRQVEQLSDSFRKFQKTVAFLADMSLIVRTDVLSPLLNTVKSLAAVVKGVRVFLSVVSEKSDSSGSSTQK